MGARMRAALLLAASVSAVGPVAADTATRDLMRATALDRRGDHALRTNQLEKARKFYGQAVEILPFFSEAHLGIGHVAMRELRFEDALDHFRKALASYSEAGDLRYDVALARYREAQERIRALRDQILDVQHIAVATRTGDGFVDRETTKLDSAIRSLERINAPTREDFQDPPGEVHFHIGTALFRMNRIEEAEAEWETCTRLSPDFPLAYNNLAVIYLKQGKIEDARRSLAKAESLGFPVNPDFKASLEASAPPAGP